MQLMSANSRGRLLDLKDMNAMVPLATPAKQPVMVRAEAPGEEGEAGWPLCLYHQQCSAH